MADTSNGEDEAAAVLLVDRFVSASSAQDALDSLESMLVGLRQNSLAPAGLLQEEGKLLEDFVALLQTQSHRGLPVQDEGLNLVCQLLQKLSEDRTISKTLLQRPAPGSFLEALLDVVGEENQRPAYTQVLALKVLTTLSEQHPSMVQSQWLQAPNGLHRVADLLSSVEVVRNEALLLAHVLAQHSPIAKVWIFAEVECKILEVCWQEGGLTKGTAVVLDGLQLILKLVQHADVNLIDLMWQRPTIPTRLSQLMDLRGGDAFLNPSSNATAAAASTTKGKKKKGGKDDLDSLLQSGDASASSDTAETAMDKKHPELSASEEKVVQRVLEIIHVLLDNEKIRRQIWKKQVGLCSLVWELALIRPPPPNVQPFCALPSPKLQQQALELLSTHIHDLETMDRHDGLDRLLYVVCTGGADSYSYSQRLGLSQAALHVLRQTLSRERCQEILLHTLAPPLLDHDDGNTPAAPLPTVVQKLWNTVAEQLVMSQTEGAAPDVKYSEQRRLFFIGALGALGILMPDDTSREMMLKIAPSNASVDSLLQTLQHESNVEIQVALLRFLCEWMIDSPILVQTMLKSNEATFFLAPSAAAIPVMESLTHLLLGLAMEYMNDYQEELYGGWTRSGIINLLEKKGINKYTASLERLVSNVAKAEEKDLIPWTACNLEAKFWKDWFKHKVWVVRKRVVNELTGGVSPDDDDDDDDDDNKGTIVMTDGAYQSSGNGQSARGKKGGVKSLQKLVAQQTSELEMYREELARATAKVEMQADQIKTWKRRVESNPTELDDLFNEVTASNEQLKERIRQLEQEAANANAEHEKELQQRDDICTQLKQTIQDLETRESEACEDRDRMAEELSSLSQAYTILEEDFRQQTAAANDNTEQSTSPSTPSGEISQGEQAQGEVSQQAPAAVSSNEIDTLRTENNRLREDARAADEWMSMAVGRMNDMTAHITSLEQELVAAKEQTVNQSNSVEYDVNTITEQLNATIQREQKLQNELELEREQLRMLEQQSHIDAESLKANLDEKSRLLHEEQMKSQGLESELLSSREQYENARELLGEAIQSREELERKLNAISNNNASEPIPYTSSKESQPENKTNSEIESKNAEIQQLTNELEAVRQLLAESLEENTNIVPSQQQAGGDPSLQWINEQLASTKAQLEEAQKKYDEEIYKRESRIRELEDRLNSGEGEFTIDDIQRRDEEIAELRNANEAAQEWMANAVERHQLLTDKVAALSEEKENLANQLNELNIKPAASEAQKSQMKLLENRLNESLALVEQLKSELADNKQKLDRLGGDTQQHQIFANELELAREEISNLRNQLQTEQQKDSSHRTEIENLREELRKAEGGSATEVSSRSNEFGQESTGQPRTAMTHSTDAGSFFGSSSMSQDVTVIQSENESLKKERDALLESKKTLEEQLHDFQAWIDMARGKITEILTDKARTESQLKESRATLEGQQGEIEDLNEKLNNVSLQLDTEVNKNQGSLQQISTLQQLLDSEAAKTMEIKSEMQFTIDQQNCEIQKLNSELAALSSRIEALQQEKEEYMNKLANATSDSESSNHILQEQIADLQSTIDESGSKLADANAKIASLQAAYKDATDKCNRIETELSETKKKKVDTVQNTSVSSVVPIETSKNQVNAADFFASTGGQIKATGTTDGAEMSQMEEDFSNLRRQVDGLHAKLSAQSKNAESRVSAAEAKCTELRKELDALNDEKEALSEAIAVIEDDNHQLESDKEDLEIQLKTTTEQLLQAEANEEKLRQELDDLKSKLDSTEAALDEAKDGLEHDEKVVKQWEERAAELESVVEDLETQLNEQEEEAKNVIAKWQESYSSAEANFETIQRELDKLVTDRESLSKQLNEALLAKDQLESEKANLQQTMSELQEKVQDTAAEDLAMARLELEKKVEEASKLGMEVKILQEKCSTLEVNLQEMAETKSSADARCLNLESELRTVQAEKESTEKALETIEGENFDLEDTKASLEQMVATLEQKLVDASQGSKDNDAISQLEAKLQQKEEALKAAEESLAQDEDVVQQWEERVSQLQEAVTSLEDQMAEQEQEAEAVITQWQESCNELEARCMELERDLEVAQGSRDEALEKAKGLENEISVLKGKHEKLLIDNTKDDAIGDDSAETLKSRVILLEQEKRTAEKHHDSLVKSWSANEIKLQMLEEELRAKEQLVEGLTAETEKANRKIDNMMSSRMIAENTELEKYKKELSKAKDDLEQEKTAHADTREDVESLRRELVDIRVESEDVVNQWTERVKVLEDNVQQLEQQLEQQETEAYDAISIWETQYSNLEERGLELEAELESARASVEQFKAQLVSGGEDDSLSVVLESLTQEKQNAVDSRRALEKELSKERIISENLKARIAELKEQIEEKESEIMRLEMEKALDAESKKELNAEISQLEIRCERYVVSEQQLRENLKNVEKTLGEKERLLSEQKAAMEQRISNLEDELSKRYSEKDELSDITDRKVQEAVELERDRLSTVIAQLEEELRDANDTMQAYVTNEVTEKATAVAAQALRNEIGELRSQVDADRSALRSETKAREDAEAEVIRLKSDLAALVSLNDEDIAFSEVQILSIKAGEKITRKERTQIEELRKSLQRAAEELERAKSGEKEANEKLSKSRLQASVCEQEVVAAKSDLNFMAQAMEEMREAEDNRRAALEHRISSLEKEQDVLQRRHRSEVENFQNELDQAMMEKDRMLQGLKDLEKTNAALSAAISVGESSMGGAEDLETEVTRLRIEKAQLLQVAVDTGSRAERKLRERIAAASSIAEADVILERELRHAAETATETLKIELQEVRSENQKSNRAKNDKRVKSLPSLEDLSSEVSKLKSESQKLKKENATLRKELNEATVKAKSEIESLTEECRKAQAKAHKLEREGRFDAEVRSEVARLRETPDKRDNPTEGWLVVSDNGDGIVHSLGQQAMFGLEAYDLIQKQREAIEEERTAYDQVLSEHDDLLALLAQQDHQNSSLREALAEIAGDEAVKNALNEAETKSLKRFGKIVRLS